MSNLDTFRQAMQERSAPNVINPHTGEVVDLETADHAYLVDVFVALGEAEKQLRDWRTRAEDELVRRAGRLGDKNEPVRVGDSVIEVDRGMTRKWDAEELIGVVSHLVGEGLLTVMDAQGLVKDEPKVDGRKAAALIGRVDGEALTELRRCFTWEQRGRARVKVTPVAELEA